MRQRLIATFLFLVTACGSGGGTPPPSGTTVLFEVPRTGQMPDFFALPFPTDLRLKTDGTIDLTGFPMGPRPDVLRGYLTPIQEESRGWATNGAAYFRFGSAIDPSTLPQNPMAATQADASIFLMDVDPASPARGMRFPVQTRYYATATVFVPERVLSMIALPGIPLRGKTRYAAVVTNRVRDAAGKALVGAATFEAVKATTQSGDADVERARALYAPALDELAKQGVPRSDVVAMAVFTTQDPTAELTRVRAYVRASVAAPTAMNVACQTDPLYIRCTGEYDSPNFQAGTAPYQSAGGNIVFDGDGNPVVQRTERLLFTLTLPKGVDVPAAGFPVALIAHGTGGSRNSFLGSNDTGDVLAKQGIAAIGIDQPLQGARDDFCPTDPAQRDQCEGLWTFNPANIVAARDNFRQGAIDNFQLLRLVKGMTIVAATAGTATEVHFDPARLYFFGHSQGGITGPLFLAVEPEIKGAVLSGSGGNLALGLLLKTEPTDIKGTIEFLLGIEGQNELDIYHPIMTAVQTFIERADPLNYASAFVANPPAGGTPKDVLITEGLGDRYTPNQATEALAAAAGANPVAPILEEVAALTWLGRNPLTPPIVDNVDGAAGAKATVVLAQYAAAPDAGTNPGKDGHFVVYWNADARRQYGAFLGSLAQSGTATFPP